MKRALAAAACVALAGGCAAAPTQIVLVIDTDFAPPGALDEVRLEVTGPSGAVLVRDGGVTLGGAMSFPLTYALSLRGGATAPVRAVAYGFARGVERVRATARAAFVPGRAVVLRLDLTTVCARQTCTDGAADQTCEPTGVCGPIDVASDALAPWTGAAARYDAGAGDPPADLALGDAHACVVRASSGAVDCWGSNASGQLGDGTTSARDTPVAVAGLHGAAVAVAAGAAHTCALLANGAVDCWGSNASGQLGDGTTSDRAAPVAVAGLTDAVELAAGASHTCARRVDGSVACWGNNGVGECGDASAAAMHVAPFAVPVIDDAVQLAVGGAFGCALRAGGAVACWGGNAQGQLGDGGSGNRATPRDVAGLPAARGIGVGTQHACAVARLDGTVVCWGWNQAAQLGNGATVAAQPAPGAPVASLRGVLEVSAGANHTCARLADGSARCWGSNGAGQLGDGTTGSRVAPVAVAALAGAARLRARSYFTCAEMGAPWSLACWGQNESGEVGNGATGGPLVTSPTAVAPLP